MKPCKKIIHVDTAVLRNNRKTGANDPAIIVKTYKSNDRAHSVIIDGPSVVCHLEKAPLQCGARVWIETTAPVMATSFNGESSTKFPKP